VAYCRSFYQNADKVLAASTSHSRIHHHRGFINPFDYLKKGYHYVRADASIDGQDRERSLGPGDTLPGLSSFGVIKRAEDLTGSTTGPTIPLRKGLCVQHPVEYPHRRMYAKNSVVH